MKEQCKGLVTVCLLFIFSFSFGQSSLPTAQELANIREELPGKTMGAKLESLLFWSQQQKEELFPIMYAVFPSKIVPNSSAIYSLPKGDHLQLKWKDSTTLSSYFKSNHIGGVIVLQDGKIRLEKYAKGVNENTLWTSFSVAKSVTSLLVGAAIKDGYIKHLDDSLQKYIPELKGHDYGNVTVEQLISMTSGMDWNEDYSDPHSDVAQMYLQPCDGKTSHILTYMKSLEAIKSGKHPWNYSTGETDLVGILVQKATGMSLAEYLSKKIWKPMGMQNDAYWLTDECSGLNIGGSGLSSCLCDYARLGLLMLNNGEINGESVVAEVWKKSATSILHPIDDKGNGYGYLWWCFKDGSYAAIGIFGQFIYVNPKKRLVIAQVAAWPKAGGKNLSAERWKFISAVKNSAN